MLTTTGFYLLMLFGYSKSLSNTRCFPLNEGGSTCFTQPDPLVALSWSSAMEWCKNFGGTLPIPDTRNHNVVYGNAHDYFGLYTETLWLGANFTYDLDNWFWTNGSSFTGTLESKNSSGKTHAYMVRNGTNVKLVAAAPTDHSSQICQYTISELSCANNPNTYWTSEKCNIKYRYSYSWYDYRSRCGQTGVACIDNLDDFSRWLDDLEPFWIGLRCSWWTWHNIVTGNSYEVIETQFGSLSNLPEDTAQCLVSDSYKDYYGNLLWTNRDCNNNLPFICQHDADATTTNPTTFAPTFTPTPGDLTDASESSSTPSNPVTFVPTSIPTPNSPTFVPTFTPTPGDLTDASESSSTPSNPVTFVPTSIPTPNSPTFVPTSTPTSIPSAMTSASVFTASTPLPVFTTIPTNSPTTAAEGDVSSSTQTATTTSLRNSNSESKPEIFGMPMEFFVGLGGGLLLAVIVWLALLTMCAYKKPGGTKIYPE